MQKLSLHAVASNSQRGLPQRLPQKCLALIIPRIKQASATHQIKLSKLGKNQEAPKQLKNNSGQLRATQGTSCYWATHKRRQLFVRSEQKSRHYWAFRSKLNRWVKLKCPDLERSSQTLVQTSEPKAYQGGPHQTGHQLKKPKKGHTTR